MTVVSSLLTEWSKFISPDSGKWRFASKLPGQSEETVSNWNTIIIVDNYVTHWAWWLKSSWNDSFPPCLPPAPFLTTLSFLPFFSFYFFNWKHGHVNNDLSMSGIDTLSELAQHDSRTHAFPRVKTQELTTLSLLPFLKTLPLFLSQPLSGSHLSWHCLVAF